ncbi:hypothetical protein [uncultured Paraglaciecola sp.]|uniref:hypothetical protein n=1 Tax=uncultured Paraglaciecola sp. TaxID=1765024 RepID=UPI0030DBE376|tara:strand:+ start:21438 stop:22196 length:759 start_codon:yes stop_codon:yes gene_type:complete
MKKWLLLSCLFSIQSYAGSISTYRIYLDSEHRQQKFMVKNSNPYSERCEISFDYMSYVEGGGEVKPLSNEQKIALSAPAQKRLRYSPRQFTIKPKTTQYVAFSYQRQINDRPAEYRTYANIKCLEIYKNENEGINFSPIIVHSVPLVIRTGKPSDLQASLTFSQVKQQAKKISFRIQHQGTRSVYGDLNLVNTQGEKIKLLQKNVVIYPEMKFKDFSFNLPESTKTNMKIVFQETGGENFNQEFILPLEGEL